MFLFVKKIPTETGLENYMNVTKFQIKKVYKNFLNQQLIMGNAIQHPVKAIFQHGYLEIELHWSKSTVIIIFPSSY